MLGIDEEDLFVDGIAVNNPTYGVGHHKESDKGSSSSSGSISDYLSVSVNPQYSFIGEAAKFISEGNLANHPCHNPGVTIPAASAGHRNGRAPLPLHDAALCNGNGHHHPYSSSAPAPVPLAPTTTPSHLDPDTTVTTEVPVTPASHVPLPSSVESTDSGIMEQQQYSYARHHHTAIVAGRQAIWITSNYANSPHANIERRLHNYLPNPTQLGPRIEEEQDQEKIIQYCGNGSIDRNDYMRYYHGRRTNALTYDKLIVRVPKFDIIIGLFSLLTIIVSLVAISLCFAVIFSFESNGRVSGSPTVIVIDDQQSNTATHQSQLSSSSSSIASGCNCSVGAIDHIMNFSDSLHLQLLSIRQQILNLTGQSSADNDTTLQQLSEYLSQIKAINDSLQQLRPQSNRPREPLLTGLNLTANITINPDECVNERTECGNLMHFFVEDFTEVGFCDTDQVSYANDTHILVGITCTVTPADPATILPNATGATINVEVENGGQMTTLQRLKQTLVRCHCYNYNTIAPVCYGYLKRCSYQEEPVSSFLSVYS